MIFFAFSLAFTNLHSPYFLWFFVLQTLSQLLLTRLRANRKKKTLSGTKDQSEAFRFPHIFLPFFRRGLRLATRCQLFRKIFIALRWTTKWSTHKAKPRIYVRCRGVKDRPSRVYRITWRRIWERSRIDGRWEQPRRFGWSFYFAILLFIYGSTRSVPFLRSLFPWELLFAWTFHIYSANRKQRSASSGQIHD